jgi:hypothetical protein
VFDIQRKAVERLYFDTCTVYGFEEVERENGSTGFEMRAVQSDLPCRLSYETVTNTEQTENVDKVVQTIKLFCSPNVIIKSGSRIDVSHNGEVKKFKSSGEPAVYKTHQEIVLTVTETEA